MAEVTHTDISDMVFTILPRPTVAALPAPGMAATAGNYPNPFRERTELWWLQNERGDVTLRIYDPAGTMVEEIAVGLREPGDHQIIVESGEMAAGVYLYEVSNAGRVITGRMTIIR